MQYLVVFGDVTWILSTCKLNFVISEGRSLFKLVEKKTVRKKLSGLSRRQAFSFLVFSFHIQKLPMEHHDINSG